MLSQTRPHPSPRPDLEQYTISADIAATMLYLAAYGNDDIVGKRVLELGCGTGRLALGAAFLGAEEVVGVDVDRAAVLTAVENSVKAGLEHRVQWVIGDIDAVAGTFDTVLQNPPFGVQNRGADRRFLQKALQVGRVVYSIHKSVHSDKRVVGRVKAGEQGPLRVSPSPFLSRFIGDNGGRIRDVYALTMTIPHMFGFHTEKRHKFAVDLYVIDSRNDRKETAETFLQRREHQKLY